MNIPHIKKGELVYKGVSLYLNHCSLQDFNNVFGEFDDCIFSNDQLAEFVVTDELGKIAIIFDNISELVIHIHLELFREIPLLSFLHKFGYDKYAYFEYLGDNHIAFNWNFAIRLNKSNNLIAAMIFFNRNYAQKAQSEFYESVKKSLENMDADSKKIPKVISLTIQ